jgi:DNA-binding FadR family transcriptional regulator
LPEHRAIYAAVAAGDVEAAKKAMTKHLKTIEGYLREHAASVSAANGAVR